MAGKSLLDQALAAEGVTGQLAALAHSIYAQESGSGKNTQTSNAGAVGGMQIIPSTFASVADKSWDINDPMLNARAGIRYLKQLHKQAGGDPRLTAVGYYGGPGGIAKARAGEAVSDPRNPHAPNTLQYADQVVARMGKTPVTVVAEGGSAPVPAPVAVAQAAPAPALTPVSSAPVMAPAPVDQTQVPDPWQQFLAQSASRPVTPEDLQYGQAVPASAPAAPLAVPNFMAALNQVASPRPMQLSAFHGLKRWG